MQTNKKEVLSFRTLTQKIRNYFLYTLQLKFKTYLFKDSFNWHIKCCLNFWRLPKLLEHSLDYFYVSESLKYDAKDPDVIAEQLMEEIVDHIWCDQLKDREYSEISDKEKNKIHKLIKEKYDQFKVACPREFLTKEEFWDRAELERDDWLFSGGYDDELPSVISTATYQLKKSKFKSKYYGDFGTGGFDVK